MRMWVSSSKRGNRWRLLFLSGNFPQGGRVSVYDVAQDSTLSRPTVPRRFRQAMLCRAEHRYGAASPGNGDGLAGLLDLAEASEACGLELGRAQYPLLHDSHDSRRYGHLTC
jgi:hypothetical protein